MNVKQKNKFEMYQQVQSLLDENTPLWNAIPIQATLKNQLDDHIQSIRETGEKKSDLSTPLGRSKNALKKAVAEKAGNLAVAINAYAAVTGNTELQDKTDLTMSDFYKAQNTQLPAMVANLVDVVEEHLENLGDYGVTAEQVTDLNTSLDDFEEINGRPRSRMVKMSQKVAQLEDLFDHCDELLYDQMDKLARRYRSSEPTFYYGYESARTIVD